MTVNQGERLVWRVFTRDHGLTCKEDAAEFLANQIEDIQDTTEQVKLLQYLAAAYKAKRDKPVLVDVEGIQGIINGMMKSRPGSAVDARLYTKVVSAFKQPCWKYISSRHCFVQYVCATLCIVEATASTRPSAQPTISRQCGRNGMKSA